MPRVVELTNVQKTRQYTRGKGLGWAVLYQLMLLATAADGRQSGLDPNADEQPDLTTEETAQLNAAKAELGF